MTAEALGKRSPAFNRRHDRQHCSVQQVVGNVYSCKLDGQGQSCYLLPSNLYIATMLQFEAAKMLVKIKIASTSSSVVECGKIDQVWKGSEQQLAKIRRTIYASDGHQQSTKSIRCDTLDLRS
eukprot:TRINITY_DN7405_c0_g1_i1.p1 TRINITY_DN7405_c0_g1~~TRINITY_DN7405_c0_g1_i1.p1  ORF type:complete len:123 (+),score=18.61 TRINITY_DN7405_c0_g1_i1:105-473(+)